MSIKGYPTQKKLLDSLTGYSDAQTNQRTQFVTAQQSSSDKVLLDVASNAAFRTHVGVKTANANSTNRVLIDTAHGALVGDIVRFELSAANPFYESQVLSIPDANTIILATELPNAIGTGDEYYILRHATQRVDESGAGVVTVQPAPISYVLDGADTEVEVDTLNGANTRALPVQLYDSSGGPYDGATAAGVAGVESAVNQVSGQLPTALGQTTKAGSLSITLASDQEEIDVRLNGVLSTNIATTTPLLSGATYTSNVEELLMYENVGLSIETDRSGTAFFEYSQDNVTFYATFSYPVTVTTPGTPESFYYQVVAKERYFRLRYVNGGTNQGVFRVQAILRQIGGVGEVQAVNQSLVGQESALVTKGVIYGLTTGGGGGYVAVKVNPSGALTTDVTGSVTATIAPNTNGSYAQATLTATTASTVTVPANAVGFILTFPSTNTDPCRWAIGSTASTTNGTYYEPGRDTGYIPCSANLSICATVSGTNAYNVQWILSA